jgi:xanthine/CO dehydrogenase XdhC/CoxF family maturation factor
MRELRDILVRARALSAAGSPAALATIVAVEGSSYRREGARLLLEASGEATGVLSGGCLERDLARAAAEVISGGAARTLVYDLTAEEEAIWGLGLGCAGRVTLLVEPFAGAAGLALEAALAAAIEERREVRVATVYEAEGSSAAIGERHFGFQTKQSKDQGFIEGKGEDQDKDFDERKNESRESRGGALGWVDEARPALAALAPGSARSTRLAVGDGSFVSVLLESIVPPVQLVVLGAERDVVPLARLGAEMGWECVVVDSRAGAGAEDRFAGVARLVAAAPRELRAAVTLDSRSAVVVATHRYLDDLALLGELALVPALGYLGLLGPEKRRARLVADLTRLGVVLDPERLRGPAGLALGGRSPHEVALAIVAEIQAALSGGSGLPLARAAAAAAEAECAVPAAPLAPTP